MREKLAELGDLTVRVDTSALPGFTELNAQECYLAWTLDLPGNVSEDAIKQVFEWAEGDCDLELRLTGTGPANNTPHVVSADSGAQTTVSTPSSDAAIADAILSSKPPSLVAAPTLTAVKDVKGDAPIGTVGDSSSIRVSVEKIDELMNTVGELVITQAMLSQLGGAMEGPHAEKLRAGLAQLERNTRELQESVMRVRMLPISFVFSRFPRMVRDLAQRLGKQIELKLSGEQTELDKTVLEKIGDPLVHLVRNSIDHGIELPGSAGRRRQTRRRYGAPRCLSSRRQHRCRSQ